MSNYTWVANADPIEQTGIIKLRGGALEYRRGSYADLTPEEVSLLSTRFILVEGIVNPEDVSYEQLQPKSFQVVVENIHGLAIPLDGSYPEATPEGMIENGQGVVLATPVAIPWVPGVALRVQGGVQFEPVAGGYVGSDDFPGLTFTVYSIISADGELSDIAELDTLAVVGSSDSFRLGGAGAELGLYGKALLELDLAETDIIDVGYRLIGAVTTTSGVLPEMQVTRYNMRVVIERPA